MRGRLTTVLMCVSLLGLSAPPASADELDQLDVGFVVQGYGEVSKGGWLTGDVDRPCPNHTGGGIGLPLINGSKFAYYRLSAIDIALVPPVVMSSNHGRGGAFVLCGDLLPVLYEGAGLTAIGAACDWHSGADGQGSVAWLDGTRTRFSDVQWDASAGTMFAFMGRATDDATMAKEGAILGLVSARGTGTQCWDKANSQDPKTGGAGVFVVDMVFALGTVLVDPFRDPIPVPDPTTTEPPACADPATHVDTVSGTNAGHSYEVAVHDTPTHVEVCATVTGPNGTLLNEDVRVPKDPLEEPEVNPDAPPGDGTGTPCTVEHSENGTSNVRAYLRTSDSASQDTVVCFGVRGGGSERHVRVTVH